MTSTLFVVNDARYGDERAYNALRLAGALAAREGQSVRLFLMAQLADWTAEADKVLVF